MEGGLFFDGQQFPEMWRERFYATVQFAGPDVISYDVHFETHGPYYRVYQWEICEIEPGVEGWTILDQEFGDTGIWFNGQQACQPFWPDSAGLTYAAQHRAGGLLQDVEPPGQPTMGDSIVFAPRPDRWEPPWLV